MKFELKPYNRNITNQELLADLRKVSDKLGKNNLTSREYDEFGKYTSGTIGLRFGNWNKALQKAELEISIHKNIPKEELFKNLEEVWVKLGKQPNFRNMKPPNSKYSPASYLAKYKTWRKALEAFIEYINSDVEPEVKSETEISNIIQKKKTIFKHKTKRNISERLKVQVLMRDGNTCKLCGITVTGENIHFDHIKPWAKGGETVLENIQILCAKHNLAKGDLDITNDDLPGNE